MHEPVRSAKATKSYTIPSFYNAYLGDIEEDSVYDIDYATYRKIVTDYFTYLKDRLLEEGRRVKLPYRLGTIQIVKSRPKHWDKRSLRIDYKATKEYNKLILLDNEHSDGFKYRMHWNKTDVLITNKSKYQLVMTRYNKRRLAKIIKGKELDYEEI